MIQLSSTLWRRVLTPPAGAAESPTILGDAVAVNKIGGAGAAGMNSAARQARTGWHITMVDARSRIPLLLGKRCSRFST